MSRNEDIDNALWSEPEWLKLSPEAKLTYLWARTNPRCGMAGFYKVPVALMAIETGLNEPTVELALLELAQAEFAFYEDHVLFVRARVKRLRTKTPQIAKAIANDLAGVSDRHPLKARFMSEYGHHPWLAHALSPDPQPTVTGTSGEGHHPTISSQNRGGSTEGHPTLKGKGRSRAGQRGGRKEGGPGGGNRDWTKWAEQEVPDLPAAFAASAAQIIASTGRDVTADAVRRRVIAQHPEFDEAAA